MISLILAEKIFSLFLMMFMGYAVVHWGLLHAEDSKTLSLISLYLISPCVIISAFQVQYTPDVLHGLLLALAAAVLLHVGIIVVVNLLGHALHLDAVEKASMIYSNAGNLIIPIVTAVLGKEWVIYSSAFLSGTADFCCGATPRACSAAKRALSCKKVLTNINMIAILAGAALFLLHIQLPAVIEDSLDMVGSAIGPHLHDHPGHADGGHELQKDPGLPSAVAGHGPAAGGHPAGSCGPAQAQRPGPSGAGRPDHPAGEPAGHLHPLRLPPSPRWRRSTARMPTTPAPSMW